jgi:hypothetical protein
MDRAAPSAILANALKLCTILEIPRNRTGANSLNFLAQEDFSLTSSVFHLSC